MDQAVDKAFMNASNGFATLFWTMQRALALARRMVAAGRENDEIRDLLFESRRLLVVMRQQADLAPEDTRDSLVDLCEATEHNIRKLEDPSALRQTTVH
jgi:hypothetical protein